MFTEAELGRLKDEAEYRPNDELERLCEQIIRNGIPKPKDFRGRLLAAYQTILKKRGVLVQT